MSNGVEYLVKYSVAPPPSRDYYGLKILQDEVILYLWRISHGPHKAPIAYRAKLSEFNEEKFIQDEIYRAFGEYVLEHVKNIAAGNINTLLTVPKSLIERIARYLKYTDVVKLSSLSHVAYEIFNADSVWQILYKRDKRNKISTEEKEANIRGWKLLYKMQISTKDQRNLQMQPSIKYINCPRINKPSIKTTADASKTALRTISAINAVARKHLESSNADLMTSVLSKTMSDARFRHLNVNKEKEKPLPPKRNERNLNTGLNVDEEKIKKKDPPKMTVNRKNRNISNYDERFNKQLDKSGKYVNKTSVNIISQKDNNIKSIISKASYLRTNDLTNIHSSSNLAQDLRGKIQSKTKPRKITTTKSEIIKTDKPFLNDSSILKNDNFDLADLLEASLKNIRSPRKIFDYDFSCMPQINETRDSLKIKNETQNIDRLKQLKPMRSNEVSNYFLDRMTREDRILEKLSEKSELSSKTSTESFVKKERFSRRREGNKLLSERYMKVQAASKQFLDCKKGDTISSEIKRDLYPRFSNKCLSSKKIDNIDEKFSNAKRTLRTLNLSKTDTSKNLKSKKSEKSSEIIPKNK